MADIIKLVLSKDQTKLYVHCPYNPQFNQMLMGHRISPEGDSPWDPEVNAWVVDPECIDTVEEILQVYFPKMTTVYTEE